MDIADNPRAVIGDNQPPVEPETTPYERVTKKVEDLYAEAKLWLDGAAVDSQELADDIGNLLALLRAAHKETDEQRKVEKAPHDQAAAEVQQRYNPLLRKMQTAIDACRKSLQPWLDKRDAEIRAEAERKRLEAEAKQQAAQAALRAADPTDLDAREAAEDLVKDAKRAAKAAGKAGKQKAAAGGDMGRSIGLRTEWVATLVDPKEAARHFWVTAHDDMVAFLQQLGQREVSQGQRAIPGFEIKEERKAV